MIGSLLGHYEISRELGRGGMGIVYQATDTKLGRTVAVKVLPAAALASAEDRARFFREAQAAAQLHHPNIATVFEIDEAVPLDASGNPVDAAGGSRPFIAMEFIEGETLSDRIVKGPLSLVDAVRIAAQVADALRSAHDKQIVHRDIKSANIMLTTEGVAKVLDFGLAKTNQSTKLTQLDTTLGTVAYMSPEQARGQDVDGRSDLYALGTVLYEMIVGRVPFAAEYPQAVVYSILNDAPEPLTALRTGVPVGLEWIVSKLLSKEPRHRYQTAADLIADLETVDLSGSGQSRRWMPAAETTARRPYTTVRQLRMPVWGLAAVGCTLAVGALGAWMLKPTPSLQQDTAIRELMLEFPGLVETRSYVISPDGRTLVFSATDTSNSDAVYRYDLDDGDLRKIPGAIGSSTDISPDGSRLIFGANNSNFIVPIAGGTPVEIVDSRMYEVAWLDDGTFVYVRAGEHSIWLDPANGEPGHVIVENDSSGRIFRGLHSIPGKRVALIGSRNESAGSDNWKLNLLDVDTGKFTYLGLGAQPKYVSTGHVIYKTGNTPYWGPLVARPIDIRRREFVGPETLLRDEIRVDVYEVDAFGTWFESTSEFAQVDESTTSLFSLTQSMSDPLVVMQKQTRRLRVSPDGRRLVYAVDAPINTVDDWLEILDLDTGVAQQLTFTGDADFAAWSAAEPDQIMVESDNKLFILSTETRSIVETLPIDPSNEFDWSPDGRYVVYVGDDAGFGPLRLFDRETSADTLLDESTRFPRFSPDGRYVAFTKQTEDAERVAVRSTHGNAFSYLTVPSATGGLPSWSRDGRNIYVTERRNNLGYRVPVDISGAFVQTGAAVVLFDADGSVFMDIGPDDVYVLTSDQNLTETVRLERGKPARVKVVVNWGERLKRVSPRTQ